MVRAWRIDGDLDSQDSPSLLEYGDGRCILLEGACSRTLWRENDQYREAREDERATKLINPLTTYLQRLEMLYPCHQRAYTTWTMPTGANRKQKGQTEGRNLGKNPQ